MNTLDKQIILDVYREHCLGQAKYLRHGGTLQEFINKVKTDKEFSEKWGLKIEERELSFMERLSLYNSKMDGRVIGNHIKTEKDFDYENIPTKLITITYKNETIESYE